MTTVVGGACLKVRLANARHIFFIDADAVVFDDEGNVSRFRASANRDFAATIGKADRVGQQIEQDLIERALVGDHFRKLAGRHFFEGNARLARPQRQKVAATGNNLARRERLRRDLEIIRLDFRHVENAVDHGEQMMS